MIPQSRIEDLEGQIEDLQDQIEDLQNQIDDLQDQVDNPQDQDQNGDEATVASSLLESEWLPLGAVAILSVVLISILLLNRVKGS